MIQAIEPNKKCELIFKVLLLNIAVLLIWGVYAQYEFHKANSWLDIGMNQWNSEMAIYNAEKGNWYIDSEMVDNPDHEYKPLLVGPMCEMEKGEYTISVDYSTESTQTIKFSCLENTRAKYDWSQLVPILDKTENHLDYDFYIDQDVHDFVVYINYNGYDTFSINRISISKNLNQIKRSIFWIICLLVIGDTFALNINRVKKNRQILFILAGLSLLSSVPLPQEICLRHRRQTSHSPHHPA